jgi:hypothetical protein
MFLLNLYTCFPADFGYVLLKKQQCEMLALCIQRLMSRV